MLHADNGRPMKGATMKTTLEKLGIKASCTRPRVGSDTDSGGAPAMMAARMAEAGVFRQLFQRALKCRTWRYLL
jgi:hypothetical protein